MIHALTAMIVVVGSYGEASDPTLHTFEFDASTGRAEQLTSMAGVPNASFLAIVNDSTLLAVNENGDDTDALTLLRGNARDGYVTLAVAPTGGAAPCHVLVSPDGTYAVTSNYLGGSISIFPMDAEAGTLSEPQIVRFDGSGPNAERQQGPHAHYASFTPDNKHLVIDDLGTDRLHVFTLDASGRPDVAAMRDVDIAPGSGPRHIAYNAAGNRAYLVNELGGTVDVLAYDSTTGIFDPLQSLHADYANAQASADIHLSPDGRFLYSSNRIKGDGIVCFAVDPESGKITESGFTPTGRHPRNFAITPDGKWMLVACRDDDRIEVYTRDTDTGALALSGYIPCPKPVCIVFL